jgi:hypothetical protein
MKFVWCYQKEEISSESHHVIDACVVFVAFCIPNGGVHYIDGCSHPHGVL